MDLSSLRALVRNLNFGAHGQDVIVDVEPEPVATRGIWLTPDTNDEPGGLDLHKRERSYWMAIPISVSRGTIIHAAASPAWANLLDPPPSPGAILDWQVDGFPTLESDHTRVRLLLIATDDPPVPNYTNEIPAGAIDGDNQIFTVAHIYAPGELVLVKNGLTLTPGVDYEETGPREITLTIAPLVGDSLLVPWYRGIGV